MVARTETAYATQKKETVRMTLKVGARNTKKSAKKETRRKLLMFRDIPKLKKRDILITSKTDSKTPNDRQIFRVLPDSLQHFNLERM